MGPTKFQIKKARKYGKKHGIPASALLELMENESGFDPLATEHGGTVSNTPSEAQGGGLTQFITSTAKSYDVKYGASKKAQASQIRGAAKYLKDLGWNTKGPREALAGYYGAASPYADELLSSTEYDKYDKGSVKLPSGGGKGSKTRTVTDKKKVLTQMPVSLKRERQAAALAFIQDDDKTSTDFLNYSVQQKELKDIPAKFRTLKSEREVKGGKEKAGSGGGTAAPKKVKNILDLAGLAEKMGLSVGEHPKYGGVAPVHATGSYHYSGRAIDVSGDPTKMAKFANVVKKRYGPKLAELFWNGARAANVDNGVSVSKGFVSGHIDHVHVAI